MAVAVAVGVREDAVDAVDHRVDGVGEAQVARREVAEVGEAEGEGFHPVVAEALDEAVVVEEAVVAAVAEALVVVAVEGGAFKKFISDSAPPPHPLVLIYGSDFLKQSIHATTATVRTY